jgi:large subunit ribosomal protein L23
MDPYDIIKYPLMTERSVNMIENENKLVFIVSLHSNKKEIAKAVRVLYEVEVDKINTAITRRGLKKAFVKIKPEFDASDIAIRLGIL